MDFERIEIERDGPILRAWLNRPEKRNAHDQLMIEEVGDLFTAVSTEFDVRVVVLGGRGPTFCAGADRREHPAPPSSDREQRYRAQLGRRATRAIEECDIPTIARVQGHAVGGGSCFATSCDFRITTESAQWWVPEVELGTPLPWAATPRLIAEIGMSRARRYVMLSERIDGPTAEAWGLAHECVPDDQLDEAVARWAQRLLDLPELAVMMAKAHFRGYGRGAALGDLSETDGDLGTIVRHTDDFKQRFADF
ncbi:MAG: enoyl-CoA hydratase/isomerase family protein [Acidimicrobiia bacterium]|nr:enoyl-CoA hydratase/isomerase family protein [Acidimicrobiia bacterium]